MTSEQLLTRLGALAVVDGRAATARALARELGAAELIVLVTDPDTGAFLPAPGLRKTLPGGATWQALLSACSVPGVHRGRLDGSGGEADAVALSDARIVLVLIGGHVDDAALAQVGRALPLLGSALESQQAAVLARGELAAARAELVHASSLARALDAARREVDRTLVELDARSRALDAARERAEQATRAKDEFLAMLGHELRNPLAPIVTALEVLRQRNRWSPEHDIMHRQVEHMMRLVDDLLDVTRIATGKLALDRETVALAPVIAQAVESVSPLMTRARPPIGVAVPADLHVQGDRGRLVQVFANLLTNALKYSDPATPVTVTVRCEGGIATIDVVDRGIGLDREDLDAVFGLFEQRGRGIDRRQGGLGLGLAIVSNLVELHGGRTYAHSAGKGQGSRFTVELPVVACTAGHSSSPPVMDPPGGRGRVLLVDDNRDAVITLAMALELSGFDVRTAHDGEQALHVAAGFRPAAAVLDIGLPGMSGYDLARALRNEQPAPPRLIALTGYGQPGDRERSAEVGFDAHLVKPVDLPLLCRTLGEVMQASAPEPVDTRAE